MVFQQNQLKLKSRVKIIAEAGVNHNGSIELAKQLVDAAADAGADFVKFQCFKADAVVSKSAAKAAYQTKTTGSAESQYEMIKRLELGVEEHKLLMDYCRQKNIGFLSSPFDLASIDLLNELGLNTFKVPSGEIVNLPYLRKLGKLNKKVILSTGMADLGEIEDALDVLVERGTNKENIIVLHCNTEYPTPYTDVNLKAMQTIKTAFGVRVGYSDHTQGVEVPVAAVVLGAEVIEKHFTLDRNMEGPDHKASLEPHELTAMVSAIRNIEAAMGDGVKKPCESERKNIPIARKSVHYARNMEADTKITFDDIIMKRPGTGISPMQYETILGKVLNRSVKEDDMVKWEDFK